MFSFLMDVGNYETRKVANDQFEWGFVSTARVSDGRKPIETAVEHADYNGGKMVIVECYDTIKEAEAGHKKWIKIMTAKKLPAKLADCGNAEVSQMVEAFGGDMEFKRKKKVKS